MYLVSNNWVGGWLDVIDDLDDEVEFAGLLEVEFAPVAVGSLGGCGTGKAGFGGSSSGARARAASSSGWSSTLDPISRSG